MLRTKRLSVPGRLATAHLNMIRHLFKYDLGEPPVFVVLKQGWVSRFQLALNYLTGGGGGGE